MLESLPPDDRYTDIKKAGRVGGGYKDGRSVLFLDDLREEDEPWKSLLPALLHSSVANLLLALFRPMVQAQLRKIPGEERKVQILTETFLNRDKAGYQLGPHTDSDAKLISVLFYLAKDESEPYLGTSLYRSKDAGFVCEGRKHHRFEDFDRIETVPYMPNAMLAFPKSNVCFHGVEPLQEGQTRDVLLYDVRVAG